MKTSGPRAYANARARAWKSRLLTREAFMPLVTLTDPERIRRTIDPPFERLLRIYQTVLRTDPSAQPLVRALLRLHEIENVKLLWRAVVRGRPFDPKLTIPLGPLATLPAEAFVATTPRQVADALAKTAYAAIANDVVRAYADDLQSAELAFDRWASRQLLDEARRLPNREALARELIEIVVAERDAEIAKRGEKWYGLTHVAQTGVSVPQAVVPVPQPGMSVPQGSASVAQTLLSVPADKTLRVTCRRAFRGDPFTLAPAIALIVLAEAEVRAVRALMERAGNAALDAPLERAIAGSQIAP